MRDAKIIQEFLELIEADDRLSGGPANIQINAPLALIQVELKAQADTLRWVLGLIPRLPSSCPGVNYYTPDKEM